MGKPCHVLWFEHAERGTCTKCMYCINLIYSRLTTLISWKFGFIPSEIKIKKPDIKANGVFKNVLEQVARGFNTAQELDMILSEKPVSHTTNPLTRWKKNSMFFTVLAEIAHSLLNIPATSTSAERTFSKARLTITKQRSSLKPKQLIPFFNKNMDFLK